MSRIASYRIRAIAFAILFAGLWAWPEAGAAQTVTGQARAVQVKTQGTIVLADTGTLGGIDDSRDATMDLGAIPSVFNGQGLRAVTLGSPDQVGSETSLANLQLTVGTTGISAGFVMARTLAVLGEASTASSIIDNLSINGVPIVVSGIPNQRITVPGGQVVINEQTVSLGVTTVNAIHATVLGVDVVIASATAGISD